MKHASCCLALLWMACLTVAGQTTTSITQFGIAWTFSEPREYGQFANGDYWVQGPVTITSMTPDWNETTGRNGWMVDPGMAAAHGYSTGTPNYNAAVRPPLPLTLTQGSVVKTIGIAGAGSSSSTSVKTAAVLTILPDIPAGRGAGYFRPPYNGTAKPLHAVADLRQDLMPNLVATASAPSLASVKADWDACLPLENNPSRSRLMRPSDVLNDYGPDELDNKNAAMLRLMCNDSWESKLPAMISFTQYALDKAYAVKLGYRHTSGDGHDPNHHIVAAWGATLLNITDILDVLSTATGFHDDLYLYQGVNTVLWGEPTTEANYWAYLGNVLGKGSRSQKDPYGYIDGGDRSREGAYQNITSQSFKGSALIARLIPDLQNCWASGKFGNMNTYAQRWVDIGMWSSPDPVAPYVHDGSYDGVNANYGVLYGPNGMGSFITGAGRWPSLHGSSKDGGQNKSPFVDSMWVAYNGYAPPADTTAPTLLSVTLGSDGGTVIGTWSEPMQGIDLTHYAISGHSLSGLSGIGAQWTWTISPIKQVGPDFSMTYTSGAGRTRDLAGNLFASGTYTVTNSSLAQTPDPPKPGRRGKGATNMARPVGR